MNLKWKFHFLPMILASNVQLWNNLVGRLEIEKYDGNPLTYHCFMAAFDEVVGKAKCAAKFKLTRLIQSTKNDAHDAIRNCILLDGEEGYKQAKDILKNQFGNDFIVTERIVQDIRCGKAIRSADDLRKLANELQNCQRTLSLMKRMSEVDSQSCILEIVSRLQHYLQLRWKRHAIQYKRVKSAYPGFEEFVDFILNEAEEATDPVYGKIGNKSSDFKSSSAKYHQVKTSNSFSADTSGQARSKWQRPPCVVCKEDHIVLYCSKFKGMKPHERLKLVVDKGLCENCLRSNHKTSDCRSHYTCTVAGCGKRHSKFIHVAQSDNNANFESNDVSQVSSANTLTSSNVYLPVISVKVNDVIDAHVLLDTGSTTTFCSSRLVQKLGSECRSIEYMLTTLSGTEKKTSKLVDFDVRTHDGSTSLRLSDVLVVDKMPVPRYDINAKMYAHLADLPIAPGNKHVDILIGQDYAEALIPLEVRQGSRGEPFAVRTKLGWSVNGPAHHVSSKFTSAISHFASEFFLDQRVKKMWDIENENFTNSGSMSVEDKKVLELWDDKVKKVDGHYELPIPWKSNVYIPNHVHMATSRLKSLTANLGKRNLMSEYDEEMKKPIINGYAESVPDDQMSCDKVWYLPHHAVVTEKKPEKTRIVFDCAAKCEGESLNDKCYQGPDLNNKLLHVLLRFRQYRYAIMADVEAMYYQVLIPQEDRDALRFLWFGADGNIQHLRMTRHVFGGIWCAASSTYALRRVLYDTVNIDPAVVDTVMHSFYVDDCLKSVASRNEAVAVIKGTTEILSCGGFKLTKFVVNDEKILRHVATEDRAKEVKELNKDAKSKALGVQWSVGDDNFYFDVNVPDSCDVTRRHILSVVSSAYDPIGLVSPVILRGRLIFQEVTRLQLSWD